MATIIRQIEAAGADRRRLDGGMDKRPGQAPASIPANIDAILRHAVPHSSAELPDMMIVDIEDFFTRGCGRCNRFDTPDCSTRPWEAGLRKLRAVCRDAGLTEVVKWAHPCYMHGRRNIAIIGAFRNDFRLSFFNAALMADPEAVLERQGPNARSPDMIRFTSNDDVARLEPVIRSYLREASGYAEAGVKPARVTASYDLPEELSEALDADPALAEAFHVLTPSRQNSYVLNLNAAKQTETRLRRIAGFRHKILAGKGATER